MEKTWRWFGRKDKITLAMLRQIGVEGIVTALHDVQLGQVWTREKIRDLREQPSFLFQQNSLSVFQIYQYHADQ